MSQTKIVKKGFASIELLMVLVLVAIVGFGAYYLGTNKITSRPEDSAQLSIRSPASSPSLTLSPSSSIEPSSEPVLNHSDWQTYTDTQAGFSIQYAPGDRIVDKKEGDYVYLSNFRIAVYDDYNGGSRREWLSNKFDLVTYNVMYEDFTVAGANALIVKASDPGSMGSTFVVIPKGNKVYLFSKDSGQESINEVKEIITTFKFI